MENINNLRTLLFIKFHKLRTGAQGKLFRTQVDLASAIYEDFSNHYKNLSSIQVCINRVLSTKINKKPTKHFPRKLQSVIMNVSLKRLTEEEAEVNEFKKALKSGFETWRNQKSEQIDFYRNHLFSENFDELSKEAYELIVFTHTPAVSKWKESRQLKEHVESICHSILGKSKLTSLFFLPDRSTCFSFWEDLREFMILEMGKNGIEADDAIFKANTQKTIQVFETSPFVCCTPSYFFKKDNFTEGLTPVFFLLSFHADSNISILECSPEDSLYWWRYVYKMHEDSHKQKEVLYADSILLKNPLNT